MAVIRREEANNDIERRIITAMITNDNYCAEISRMAKASYFKLEYAKVVFGWIAKYWGRYKKSPGKDIQAIFDVEREKMKEVDAAILERFLIGLSDEYEESGTFNWKYFADQTRDYCRQRALEILCEQVSGNLVRGKLEESEKAVRDFHMVAKEVSKWFNPFDNDSVQEVFNEDDANQLFSFPGPLGELAGVLEREWLIAFMGPMKRGKSWYLQELVICALVAQLKVAYISLEMSKTKVSKRLYKRLTAHASKTGSVFVPKFDCMKNQRGTCDKPFRACKISIMDQEDKETPEYYEKAGYKPCSYCREHCPKDYEAAVWGNYKQQKEVMTSKMVSKKVKDFKALYGDNLRIISYPAFSANFDDVMASLDELEYSEGFVPDVICIDYVDIMDNCGIDDERTVADRAWKRAKGLSDIKHCLVATVLQSNRKSMDNKQLKQKDTGEDIRKLAHVELMFALNQTPEEKRMGVMRISALAHRHDDFDVVGDVLVLQSYALGMPLIDSEWSS